MIYEQIRYDVSDRVATLTLDRPEKLNAWTPRMEEEIRDAMSAAAADEGVRVIVLTGAGRGFCAGADMALLAAIRAERGAGAPPPEAAGPDRTGFSRRHAYFPTIPKPIVAAVNGPAVGLGLILTLYCDLRIASEAARFGSAFARRGLVAEHGMAWLLPRLIGLPNALDLLLTGRLIDAAEALRMGLVSRVVAPAAFAGAVRELALELAGSVSPRSLRVMKRQVYDGLTQTLGEAIDAADVEMQASFDTDDFREGVAHFVERRPPAFTGR
jgi:enoyl-CoA hydratase/carnithine racemase